MKNTVPAKGEDFTIIFIGMNKTGTTTLHSVFVREYGLPKCLQINPDREPVNSLTIEEFRALPETLRRNFRTVTGHMFYHWNIHQAVPLPYYYVTLLRNPVERVVSFYYYVIEKQHHYSDVVKKYCKNLEEFVTKGYAWNDLYTKYLSSVPIEKMNKVPDEAYASALENFESRFSLVGFTDKMAESVVLFKRFFHWNGIPAYKKDNPTKNRPKVSELPSSIVDLIKEYNQNDIAFCEIARKKFDEMLAKQDDSFASEAANLKKLNPVLLHRLEGPVNDAVYYYGRGEHLVNYRDWPNAEMSFKGAIGCHRNYLEAYNNLGTLYFNQGNIDQAVQYFKLALNINPLDKNAVFNYGEAMLALKQYDEALKVFQHYLAVYPDDMEIMMKADFTEAAKAGVVWELEHLNTR